MLHVFPVPSMYLTQSISDEVNREKVKEAISTLIAIILAFISTGQDVAPGAF